VYGANASGKSNLTRAIRFMRQFVLGSSKDSQAKDPIGVEAFRLSTDTVDEPSFFEVTFIADRRRYRYGFKVNRERVIEEWLYHVPASREARLFTRTLDAVTLSGAFKEGKDLADRTRSNALFLSVVAQFNGSTATTILDWFRRLRTVSGLDDQSVRYHTLAAFSEPGGKEAILRFVQDLDLGISDIMVEKVPFTLETLPEQPSDEFGTAVAKLQAALEGFIGAVGSPERFDIRIAHEKHDSAGRKDSVELFDLDDHESEGTKKLFSFAGPILDALKKGSVLVIDELDARLHPVITQAIVRLFNCRATNQYNAQLVFTTHDTNLLTNKLFRRDQIWFTEKDRLGATHVVSLAEYRVRNDASFERDYIQGRYGAVPFLGNLQELMVTCNE